MTTHSWLNQARHTSWTMISRHSRVTVQDTEQTDKGKQARGQRQTHRETPLRDIARVEKGQHRDKRDHGSKNGEGHKGCRSRPVIIALITFVQLVIAVLSTPWWRHWNHTLWIGLLSMIAVAKFCQTLFSLSLSNSKGIRSTSVKI